MDHQVGVRVEAWLSKYRSWCFHRLRQPQQRRIETTTGDTSPVVVQQSPPHRQFLGKAQPNSAVRDTQAGETTVRLPFEKRLYLQNAVGNAAEHAILTQSGSVCHHGVLILKH